MTVQVTAESMQRGVAPETLQPNEAWLLARADIRSRPGSIQRAKGHVHSTPAEGDSSAVIACGAVLQRNQTPILVWMAGGILKAEVNLLPAYTDASF